MASRINFDPDRPQLDGRNLAGLVDAYLRELPLRGLPVGTCANYGYLLGYLLTWWESAAADLGNVLDANTWAAFDRWLSTRQTRQGEPLALSTRRACLTRCRQLLRWAYRAGHIDREFSEQIPHPRGESLRRRGPGVGELRRLLAAAGQGRNGGRDRALVAVIAGTGIRRAEAAALDVPDLQFHADGGGALTVRKGKGSKQRRVVFDAVAGGYLLAWLEERQTGPVFCGWKGRRLSAHSVYRIVKQACKLAGIDERGRGPHDLRRSFATHWTRSRRGLGDGQLLSQQMGHSSQQTTLIYSGLDFDDLTEGFTSPLTAL